MALARIEREAFPNISFDIVQVKTVYPSSPPEVIEKRITLPLEKKLKEVGDVKKLESVSLEGVSLIWLTLEPDADNKDQIVTDIERAVQEVTDLPADLEERPLVREIKSKDTPLLEVALSGLPDDQLRKVALDFETAVLDVNGISSAMRKGLSDLEIWVEVDPKKMEALHLGFPEINQALAAQNVNIPGGLKKGEGTEFLLRTSGELETVEDVKNVVIRANDSGNWIRVGDVAHVEERIEEQTILQRTDGGRSINFLIVKRDRSDALRLKEKLDVFLAEFKAKSSPQLKIAVINDFSYYIQRRLNVLVSNGWIGFLLVIISLSLFLSPRVTLGAVFGMPTAFLAAIMVMKWMGMSINLISMFGLIIVLGMLVDEDVVIAENISRYLEEGMDATKAAIRGAAEVSGAIISTVLTTIIAFVPFLFMTGIFGKFVGDIARAVIITLGASLLEALIILPSHLAGLNRQKEEGPKQPRQMKSHHLYDKMRAKYVRSLEWSLKRSGLVSLISMGVMIAAISWGIFGMRFILFPAKGIESFFVRVEAPLGTPLEITEERVKILEDEIAQLPPAELDHFATQVGISQNDPNDPFTQRGSHVAQIQLFLTPESKRDRDAQEIAADLRQKIKLPPGFEKIHFDQVNPGPPVGKPVAIRVRGNDFQALENLVEEIKKSLQIMRGVSDIRDDFEVGKSEWHVVVDLAKASQSQLTVGDVGLAVREAFGGWPATSIRRGDEEIRVLPRLSLASRYDAQALHGLKIPNRLGILVPLDTVARVEEMPGVHMINHYQGKRAITITGNVDEAITSSREVNTRMTPLLKELAQKNPSLTIDAGGEWEDTQESMNSLFKALVLASILIFMVLLLTFHSFLQTFVLMLAIPFGAVGAVIGFTLHGEPFGFLSILGLVGLSGVVVDGGTLLFTFINQRKEFNPDVRASIMDACSVRLRPIFLTTVTTIFGILPSAYGIGGNDPFIRPMALALNWGLAFSVLFTLYSLPCLYFWCVGVGEKIKRK